MDPATEKAFGELLKQFGPAMGLLLAVLFTVIWWLARQLVATQEMRDKDRQDYAKDLKEQRDVSAKVADTINNLTITMASLRDMIVRRR